MTQITPLMRRAIARRAWLSTSRSTVKVMMRVAQRPPLPETPQINWAMPVAPLHCRHQGGDHEDEGAPSTTGAPAMAIRQHAPGSTVAPCPADRWKKR